MRGRGVTTKDDVLCDWQRSGVDIVADTRVAEVTHVGIVGYATFSNSYQDYARIRGSVFMHPGHRKAEIEDCLLDWIGDRAQDSLQRIPIGKRVALSHLAMAQDRPRQTLLTSRGYALVHHSLRMHLELPSSTVANTMPPA